MRGIVKVPVVTTLATALPLMVPSRALDSAAERPGPSIRSEEHTSELQSLMRISYAVFCLKKKNTQNITTTHLIHNSHTMNNLLTTVDHNSLTNHNIDHQRTRHHT